MSPRLFALPLLLLMPACMSEPSGPSEPYAFVGSWDCGVETFTFTNTTYNDGTNTYPIQNVAKNGSNYTLRFGNGYVVALGRSPRPASPGFRARPATSSTASA